MEKRQVIYECENSSELDRTHRIELTSSRFSTYYHQRRVRPPVPPTQLYGIWSALPQEGRSALFTPDSTHG